MKAFGKFLLTTIGAYFIGAVTLPILGPVADIIQRFGTWAYSLPIWAVPIVYIVIGYIVIELYKKLPKPKEE